MNTLNKKSYYTKLNNLFKVLRSDAVGKVWGGDGTIERDEDGNYVIDPIDVQEVERMCIELGLSYELLGMWGIRIWSF